MLHSTPARNREPAPGSQLWTWVNSRDIHPEAGGKGANASRIAGIIDTPVLLVAIVLGSGKDGLVEDEDEGGVLLPE